MSAGKLGELLVSNRVISDNQLKQGIAQKNKLNIRLSTALVQLGHINDKVLTTFLSKQYGIPAISLDDVVVPNELKTKIPHSLCERHVLIPLGVENEKISIALSDPTNVSAIDDVRFLCNSNVNVYLSTEAQIVSLIERTFSKRLGKIDLSDGSFSGQTETVMIDLGKEDKDPEPDDKDGEKTVIQLLNRLLAEAIRRKCSDIHIEPYETYCRVRFRMDGALHEVMRLPPGLKKATPARIKVMSQLDISEKRLPQDGRMHLKSGKKKVDIRVSILPTVYGEKVCMRILDQGESPPDLVSVGFEKDQYDKFIKAAMQPYGMVLVTGPTGSGKSTTLFAALNQISGPDVNVSTVEDPVEYNMDGVNQVQVKTDIDLTFSSALRSLLRQDPDTIMVGEIRDQETAEIAVKAALTGHMVLSTLHTNDASSTITRLVHMGIEPFLITAALLLVQAQRLIRVVCPNCKMEDKKVTEQMLIDAEVPKHWIGSFTPLVGPGCDHCNRTGYSGRKGIFEVLNITEKIRELIIRGSNADEIKKMALQDGMTTLRQAALLKLYKGETTLAEALNNSRPDGEII